MLLPRLTRVIAVALWLLANPMSAQVHEGYASVPGARLFYIDTGGSGVPVVFLHPATGSVRVWEYQIPAFTAAGYRVIAFDRRGWGRTVVDPQGPQPGTAAEDLLALLDSLGIQRAHIVGSAAGGFVAFDFALSFPQRLRSLIVANSVGGLQDPEFLEIGRRIRPSQFDALPPEVREVGPSYRAAHREGTQRWVDLEKISRPEGPRAPAQPMRNRITFPLLETIKLPTLLITGGADMYAPPPIQQSFAAHIKGAQTLVVPEAGHSTYWEQPEQFNRAVIDFIARH
ncbi:MAG TPA: alpha/beta hydrolase [Bryobacteraceae bacterium]|nr:alpha/beta hydrolase [Bryobacteraceae bacterium]